MSETTDLGHRAPRTRATVSTGRGTSLIENYVSNWVRTTKALVRTHNIETAHANGLYSATQAQLKAMRSNCQLRWTNLQHAIYDVEPFLVPPSI